MSAIVVTETSKQNGDRQGFIVGYEPSASIFCAYRCLLRAVIKSEVPLDINGPGDLFIFIIPPSRTGYSKGYLGMDIKRAHRPMPSEHTRYLLWHCIIPWRRHLRRQSRSAWGQTWPN